MSTQYIDRDGAAIAYQVVGDGPPDVVHFYEVFHHLDLQLMDSDINHNVERMARFARTVSILGSLMSASSEDLGDDLNLD